MRSVFKALSDLPGWHTKNHLVILESDDWGSIRMPSNKIHEKMFSEGQEFLFGEGRRYNTYDSLATKKDLASLFEVLNSVKDSSGRPVVFNPISVVSNPDFKKIRESNFENYFYEPFTETLKGYKNCEDSFSLWQQGMAAEIFLPQFHGREHLNVPAWMRVLKKGHSQTTRAFEHKMWGISTAGDPTIGIEIQAAYDLMEYSDLELQRDIITSGLDLFERLFGYRAELFVPPNGMLNSNLENTCVQRGIKFISTAKLQKEPQGGGRYRRRFHWLGQKGIPELRYSVRNCFFEPSQPGKDWADFCLKQVGEAFKWKKPAIISTHRVNYIGALHESNRDKGLNELKSLLESIMKYWPDTRFISSSELGKRISHD